MRFFHLIKIRNLKFISMSIFLKQFVIIILIVMTFLSSYFGAYRPLIKSRLYISALKNNSMIRSVSDLIYLFSVPLEFKSFIGDEEMIKFLSSDLLAIVSDGRNNEEASRAIKDFIEPYLIKDNVRHLMVLSQMHFTLWERYKNDADYEKSKKYLLDAYAIGPKLPPILYGLLDLYTKKGETEKAKEIAKQILTYWPDDEKVKSFVGN